MSEELAARVHDALRYHQVNPMSEDFPLIACSTEYRTRMLRAAEEIEDPEGLHGELSEQREKSGELERKNHALTEQVTKLETDISVLRARQQGAAE